MSKPRFHRLLAVAACALCALGVIVASNIGFKLSYEIQAPPDTPSGTNWIGLPYKMNASLQTASDIFADLGGNSTVNSVSRFDPQTDTIQTYTGGAGNDFALTPGEGLIVDANSTFDYQIAGSHDPAKVIKLKGPAESLTGNNQYTHPYHANALTAGDLATEIGAASVVKITRWSRPDGALLSYAPGGTGNFTLVPGESYRIQVDKTVFFAPRTKY